MSKENNSNNIYRIPETSVSSESSKSNVDYIDYIYAAKASDDKLQVNTEELGVNTNDKRVAVEPLSADTNNVAHIEQYRKIIEKRKSDESINEIQGIAEDLEQSRAEFILNNNTLNSASGNFIKAIFGGNVSRKPATLEQLKAEESKVGSAIFGETPGVRTEFFNDNPDSWFFYQEFVNKKGDKNSTTLHYEVHPEGVLRIKDNEIKGCLIEGEEMGNFLESVRIYYKQVMLKIYNKQPYSSQSMQKLHEKTPYSDQRAA